MLTNPLNLPSSYAYTHTHTHHQNKPTHASGKGLFCDLHNLTCTPIRPVGSSCRNGNECGEEPFDARIGADCVRGSCVDTSKANANCWPNMPYSHCTNERVCRRTAAAAAAERARLEEAARKRSVEIAAA